ncbi:BET1-like protein isoform X2 [Procambarus clarkii]|uniref:BET1-like protein isoform X2 n=1 Tax=Procambarus clarkii TaxID=6728 RepID=UPI001E675B78|nr:BET1-like protein [Procambarus clarkii]
MASWGGAEESELDSRNQQRSYALAGKVSTLRSLALDIENEAYEHNRLLDGVSNDFSSGEGLLSGSTNRVKNLLMSGRQNRKAMCYMAGFVVVFVLILWYLISRLTSG